MTGALIILSVTIAFGLLLYYTHHSGHNRHTGHTPRHTPTPSDSSDDSSPSGHSSPSGRTICCGTHAVCEKLASPYVETPIYYEDEELDRYAGRDADTYTDEETDEFREVLMTMREDEVPGWLDSLAKRRIPLPPGLRDEVALFL